MFENGSDTIVSEGLAYDRTQVGIVTNVDVARHTGRHYITTPQQVFNVLRTRVDVVQKGGAAVLNAKSEELVEMAGLCDGEVIYFAYDAALPIVSYRFIKRERGNISNGRNLENVNWGNYGLIVIDRIAQFQEQQYHSWSRKSLSEAITQSSSGRH